MRVDRWMVPLTFTKSGILLHLFVIANIRTVSIEQMKKKFGEASNVEVCALLHYRICSDNTNFTVDLLVLQNPGL